MTKMTAISLRSLVFSEFFRLSPAPYDCWLSIFKIMLGLAYIRSERSVA